MDGMRAFVDALFWTRPGAASRHAGHGSLFFLDLGGPTFAVTADHVVAGYLEARKQEPRLQCSIDGFDLALEDRIIDRDYDLDLATFRVHRAELARIGRRAYACPAARWPPAPPEVGETVMFAGFFRRNREVAGDGSARFRPALVRARVTDVNDRHVACTVSSEGRAGDAAADPPLLRGASGAPLWTRARASGESWTPAGIAKKCLERHGVLVAGRLDAIEPDGTLKRWM